MSDIKIPIEIETKGAGKAKGDINGVTSSVEDLGKSADKTGDQLKEMIKQTAAFAGLSLGAAGLKEFGSKLIDVRKEMQGYSTSLNVLLGDQEKANAMFAELKEFAVTTPLMLKDLASGAQTMLGFNIEAEKVVPTLKAIGDISMGDSQRFQSLTLAFSQMSATGKLMGQDLLQMINAGFNPLMEISRKTGKSIGELKDEMSNGAISAQMVADAFMSATQEGGQFYGMISAQGKTLAGQINTLKGAIDDMFNTLGEQGEGIISGTVSALTTLVQNYEKVGKAIVTLVASYGAYKAALIATDVLVLANARGSAIALSALKELVLSTKAATAAQAAFNAVAKMNPYVLLASAVVAAVGVVWTLSDSLDQATVAQNNLNRSIEDFDSKQKEQKETAESLISVLQDQTKTDSQRARAYKQLSEVCAELTNKYSQEELSVMSLTEAYRALNEVQEQGRAKKLQGDTETLVRVYNDLLRVSKGQQSVGSAETQAFIKANGLTGMDPKEVRKMLRSQINKNQEELSSYNNNPPGQKEEVKNKEYWEKQKNDAQKELDALTDIEAKGSKGAAMRKKIAEYQSKIDIYSVSKNSGKDSSKNAAHLAEVERQQAIEQERARKDQALATEQAYIDGLDEGGEKTRRQIELNFEKEKEAIRREQEDLLAGREKNAKELWEADNASLVKKGATWEGSKEQADFQSKNELTEEDKAYFKARCDAATKEHERSIREQEEAEKASMRQYLIDYGTMYEQRYALSKEYDERIRKAKTEGERLALEAEREGALQNIDVDAILQKVDYATVFQNMGVILADPLNKAIEELEEYVKSADFDKLSLDNKQKVLNTLGNAKSMKNDGFSGLNLNAVKNAMNSYVTATQQLVQAKQREQVAVANLEARQKAYDNAVKNGTGAQKNLAKAALDAAEAEAKQASGQVVKAQGEQVRAQETATESMERFNQSLMNVNNLASSVMSGSLSGIWDSLGTEIQGKVTGFFGKLFSGDLFKKVSDATQKATEAATDTIAAAGESSGNIWGMIVGAILSIVDQLGKDHGLTDIAEQFTEKIAEALEVAGKEFNFDTLFVKATDMLGRLIEALLNSITSSLTFGMFNPETSEDFQDSMDELAKANEGLKQSVDALKESMDKSNPENAEELYNQSVQNIGKAMLNTQEMMRRSGAKVDEGLWGTGIGGTHSSNSHINGSMSSSEWERISQAAGASVGSASDFWNLSSKQMYDVMKDAPDLYGKIKALADDGYQDAGQFMDEYINYWKQLEDLEDDFYERMTNVSFDSMKDNFKSNLMDMNKDAKDFADDFSEMMMSSVLESALGQNGGAYDQLEQWRKDWAAAMQDGLTQAEKDLLKKQYDDIVKAATSQRDELAKLTGYDKDQGKIAATTKSVSGMSEDTGNAMVGGIVSISMSNHEISMRVADGVSELRNVQAAINGSTAVLNDINVAVLAANGLLSQVFDAISRGNSAIESAVKGVTTAINAKL